MIRRQRKPGVLGDLEDRLHQALAEGRLADDQGAIMILQRAGDDLRRRGRIAVHQHHDRILQVRSMRRAIDLIREGASTLRNDDLALLQKLVAHIDGLVQQAARVAAQVDHQTVNVAELVESVAHLAAGRLHEVGHVDIADARLDREGEIDRRPRDLIANQIEVQGLRRALAVHRHRHVRVARSLQQRRHRQPSPCPPCSCRRPQESCRPAGCPP